MDTPAIGSRDQPSAPALYDAPMLEDGTYEAVVVDADEGPRAGSVRLGLAVLAGPHKGELVTVVAADLGRDPLDVLAVPATLVVADGQPHVTLEG